MKNLHLAMQVNVPSQMVCAIEYGAEGEYGLNSHELDMVHRFINEKLSRCYNPICDWGREGEMTPDNLFQLHHDMQCMVLKVYCPIPNGMKSLYRKMRSIAKAVTSFRYDFTIYDINAVFSNPIRTPFLWAVHKSGTHIGMMNLQKTKEIVEKYPEALKAYKTNGTWMDCVFHPCIFGSDYKVYYYDGRSINEVTREQAINIQHEYNKMVVDMCSVRMAA